VNIITTRSQLDEMVEYYLKQESFAFDVETVGTHRGVPAVNEVMWISFATRGRGDVIPMGHPNGEFIEAIKPLTGQGQKRVDAGLKAREADYSRDATKYLKRYTPAPTQLFPAEVFEALRPLMFNENIITIGHNLVFDLSSVAKYYGGQVPSAPYFDTMAASFLYDSRNFGKLGLDDCALREFGYKMVKGIGAQVENYAFDEVAKYSYIDAKYTFLLWQVLVPKLAESKVERVMALEMDLLRVLCQMKLAGAHIDENQLNLLKERLEAEVEVIRSDIYRIAGEVFNINSNAEKQRILYTPVSAGGRGLRTTFITGRGKKVTADERDHTDYSVSAEALEENSEDELVKALLAYAEIDKLLSTYVIPYVGGEVIKVTSGKTKTEIKAPKLINGKVYGDFKPLGTLTGRFSSANPNLQNLPAPNDKLPPDRDFGTLIRNMFWAPEGYKLVVADYSQIEPRIIAAMSKDPIMLGYYKGGGGDIYTEVGNTMGIDRKAGKTLVLSIAYGVGPEKIAADVGCTKKEAEKLLSDFSAHFPSVDMYKARVIGAARNVGYVSTVLQRRRYLPDLKSNFREFRSKAERQAFNTRIQGSAADLIKLAMIKAYDSLPKGAQIILTVHDEIVTLTPDAVVEETREAIRSAMEGIDIVDVPLTVDLSVVQKWGEAK